VNINLLATIQRLQDASNPIPWQVIFYAGEAQSWLDLGSNDGRTHRGLDRSRTTAIELFEPSVEKLRQQGFAQVRRADIRDVTRDYASRGVHFERVTAFDVIEHIPKEDGYRVLADMESIASRQIVIMMPIETPELAETQQFKDFREWGLSQHPDAQRELHDHRSQWSPADLRALGYEVAVMQGFHGFFDAMVGVKCVSSADMELIQGQVAEYEASGPARQAWGYMGQETGVVGPLYINGQKRIFIGDRVTIGWGARLEAITKHNGDRYGGQIVIGDGSSAEMFLHVGAIDRVTIGRDVMIGGHVTILDHDHGWRDAGRPPRWQPLIGAPVTIGDGAWIGEYAFIGKGVTIGEGAIVGAHSVVLRDVPPMAVVAGNPAKIVKWRDIPHEMTSIIIPTCDGWENLSACVESIERCTPEPYELIIVDNGSTGQDTLTWLGQLSDVKVIRNDTNRGFAAACNQGLAVARGQYLCLLNDDTEVTPGWLTRLIGTLKRYPDVGIVGPMTDCASGPQGVQPGYDVREHWGQSDDTERLVGFCLLMRREVYDQIGPMDERYGLGNFDEDDYEVTARLAGWHLRMVRDVWIHHKGSQTFKRLGIDYDSLLEHNRALFMEKWQAREGVCVG